MKYTVKNKSKDTYIQEPFSDRITEAFKAHETEIRVMESTVITIVGYDYVDAEHITIYVSVA